MTRTKHAESSKPRGIVQTRPLVIDSSGDESLPPSDSEWQMSSKRTRSTRKPTKGQSKRPKRTSTAGGDAPKEPQIHYRKGYTNDRKYRQPAFRLIDDVYKNPTWQDCIRRVDEVIKKVGAAESTKSQALGRKATLSDLKGPWAIVEDVAPGQDDGEGGPCDQCVKNELECVIRPAPADDEDPMRVATNCMPCYVAGKKCDLKKAFIWIALSPSPEPSSPILKPVAAAPRPVKTSLAGDSSRKHRQTAPDQTITLPQTGTRNARLVVDLSTGPSHAGTTANTLSPPPSPSQIQRAMTDLRKFRERMQAILSKRGELEFEAALTFEEMETQIVIIEQYPIPEGWDKAAPSAAQGISAIISLQKYVRELEAGEIKDGQMSTMVGLMFRKVGEHISLLEEVIKI